ncbi:MAG: CoA transferase [Actinomycetota bacterium]|nr:CoA transferase [Actinomycetota bacterium]
MERPGTSLPCGPQPTAAGGPTVLGAVLARAMAGDGQHAVRRWAGCGAMTLTGMSDGPPSAEPARVALGMDALAEQLAVASRSLGGEVTVDGAALLGERAALAGLARRGRTSCGGGTRLLPTADGWMALSLARGSDVELLDAWLEAPLAAAVTAPGNAHGGPPIDDAGWARVEGEVARHPGVALVQRAGLLGLPCALLGEVSPADHALVACDAVHSAPRPRGGLAGLMVVDLSSLWAGPLAGHLLGLGGAEVVKVESTGRPDGARSGPTEFFDLLHAGHRSVALDFTVPAGRAALLRLLLRADVVVEASRPRALAGLGASFDLVHAEGWRGVWLSVTGHGRAGEAAMRVAFGDDAAAAGGLLAHAEGGPVFCADAIADPATGLLGAVAVMQMLAAGRSGRVSVSLAATAAHLAAGVHDNAAVAATPATVAKAPHARQAGGVARPLGADTAAVLEAL